jgi:hypothetical protein
VMLSSTGNAMIRAAVVVPVVLLVVFIGLLWLLRLLCDRGRRHYVTGVSKQARERSTSFSEGHEVRSA